MCNIVADAHLQIERKRFAFIATANTLYPRRNFCVVGLLSNVDNQKKQTELRNSNRLTKTGAFECVTHNKLIVVYWQSILAINKVKND